MRGRALLLALGLPLVLAACERPAWTDPAKSKGPHATQAAAPKIPTSPDPAPAPPAWAASLIGKRLAATFPEAAACVGNADAVRQLYQGPPAGAELIGWGWEVAARHRTERVLLVDAQGRIVGAGESGLRRADVPRVIKSIPDDHTGWQAVAQAGAGPVEAYGLVQAGRAVCHLGRLEF